MKFLKQRLKHNAQSRSGFTLVELIVVLVILAILTAFTIPAMLGFVEDAKGKAAIAEAREVYVAAQSEAPPKSQK
ncbi:type II secretion system protein [Eubacterium maltosivorans]|uniref:Type II secretion system protein n=1 Tax=Eubacterium maltosivorans TaxID=2041044 RepID=A0A4P9CAH2_EUBML|nr:type II secretion system protein [Eubacterium maltosivorans]QCT71831.1 type II secretion system protein [Eubacterium maltosivorans]